ncbi:MULTISPECIES: pseudaminic acid synthase [unclassified Campylobacter]|uniref:pseudaminic acid synthase n=1 Tax=unclassified Campylobacter TaxID=2593542 RepID=UPI001237D0D8|nr:MULTISPECIES: pseudaminic acid synthase [unclassified Campylobacter]KAA6225433.1 pseudaminic acid synthase [Campylobacter sp. LR196d]KAA6229922.1 pseudaminic acid synthase [Campylobacter sp. LR286c]KAA6234446.1 pseudaminic acid synthase [Campylobacter sp. LR264d]
MKIANFDTNEKVFIIAELSANHAGDLDLALKSIAMAKKAGADAIKIQTYTPDSLTLNCDKDDFLIKGGLWDKRRLYELYESAKTPYEWHSQIFEAAQDNGILCFSSPFCQKDIEFLKRFDPVAYKIASFEANDENFIRLIAKEKKPSIVSTGIATINELKKIKEIFESEGNENLMFLKCTSAYPALAQDLNLRAILSLKNEFNVEVGLSDHSPGFLAPVMAVAFGARAIEKHFVIDKSIKSEDSAFSLDFDEFKSMVDAVRQAEKMLGEGSLELTQKGLKNREFARSLYASANIKKGELFSLENVKSVRPNFGLHPSFLSIILGKKATKNIEFGTALKESDFE